MLLSNPRDWEREFLATRSPVSKGLSDVALAFRSQITEQTVSLERLNSRLAREFFN